MGLFQKRWDKSPPDSACLNDLPEIIQNTVVLGKAQSLIPRPLLETFVHALHHPSGPRTPAFGPEVCLPMALTEFSPSCYSLRMNCLNGSYLMIIIRQGTVTLLIRWALCNLLVQEHWVFSLLIIALSTPRESKIGGAGELRALPEGKECNHPFLLIQSNPLCEQETEEGQELGKQPVLPACPLSSPRPAPTDTGNSRKLGCLRSNCLWWL